MILLYSLNVNTIKWFSYYCDGTKADPFHCSCAECLSKTQGQSTSSSPKQMSLCVYVLFAKTMRCCLRPWCSVSNERTLTLSMLPVEILRKIGGFASVEAMRNLIATCKYIRNQLNTWFLQLLASENNPDRATSGFIIDAIGNKGNTCLWCNAKFFIKDHDVPKDLSIHLFANTTAKKISSDEVRSMIIQLSGSPKSYDIRYSQIPKISFLSKCHSRIWNV